MRPNIGSGSEQSQNEASISALVVADFDREPNNSIEWMYA
jgi:hypothetical protein